MKPFTSSPMDHFAAGKRSKGPLKRHGLKSKTSGTGLMKLNGCFKMKKLQFAYTAFTGGESFEARKKKGVGAERMSSRNSKAAGR